MILLTLPLRVAVGAARLGLGVAERLLEALLPGAESSPSAAPGAEPAPPAERTEPLRARRRTPQPMRPAEPAAPAEPPEPEHVSEEPVLVAEVADAGAEDGPGPAISVAEPWDGYRAMKADEVVARIAEASREELAVIELYEGTHRRRKTVLAAAERQLKLLSPPGRR